MLSRLLRALSMASSTRVIAGLSSLLYFPLGVSMVMLGMV